MGMLRVREKPSGKKLNRKPGHAARIAEHEAWLRSMGINTSKKPTNKRRGVYDIPNYKVEDNAKLSNQVSGNGSKKETIKYTGDEIMGVVLNHKSNYEPVRKDNKKAAVDASQMRRN